MNDAVPPVVVEFIMRHVHSVAHLEALLMMRSNSHQSWDAGALAKRLYVAEDEARQVLTDLQLSGLTSSENGLHKYMPATTLLDDHASKLYSVYGRHLIQVTNLIHSKPPRARQFAEAFRVRKGE